MPMKTIQVVVDESTLAAADRAARRAGQSRSELVREALRRYLATSAVRQNEAADRDGYRSRPQALDELDSWDAVQAWPED